MRPPPPPPTAAATASFPTAPATDTTDTAPASAPAATSADDADGSAGGRATAEKTRGTVTWFTPQCHSAGGGDNVVFVEGNALVTRALSPWKRRRPSVAAAKTKTLLTLAPGSVCHFVVAPDHRKVAVLDVHPTTQRRRLRVLLGEELLDPLHPASVQDAVNVVEIPVDAAPGGLEPAACWFSPDAAQLLVYSTTRTRTGTTATAVVDATSSVAVAEEGEDDHGATEEASLGVYHLPMRQFHADVVRFHPTRYFRATYVPFFTQYAQVYNPWAPDSKSFLYHTASGVHHWPLHRDRTRASPVGMDAWLHQDAAFATWSRQ